MITSTALAAEAFLAITSSLPIPTVSSIPAMLEQPVRLVQKNSSVAISSPEITLKPLVPTINATFHFDDVTRPTTEPEKIIGDLREWRFFEENWDGENANAPSIQSIRDAIAFVRLIKDKEEMPQPMLHASGNVSLYWNNERLYADIEFLGDGLVAYFIKHLTDKHKGILSFDTQKMPAVFSTLIWT